MGRGEAGFFMFSVIFFGYTGSTFNHTLNKQKLGVGQIHATFPMTSVNSYISQYFKTTSFYSPFWNNKRFISFFGFKFENPFF